MSAPPTIEGKQLQPPLSTGPRLLRRWNMVPASMDCVSTLRPMRLKRSAATWDMTLFTGWSVGSMSTARSPL